MAKICFEKKTNATFTYHAPNKQPLLFAQAAFACIQPDRGFGSDVFSRVQIVRRKSAAPNVTTYLPAQLRTVVLHAGSLFFARVSGLLVHMIAAIPSRVALVLIALISSDIYSSPLCNINRGKKKKELHEK